jgi:tetratricopeptide (TPR) repeat protein
MPYIQATFADDVNVPAWLEALVSAFPQSVVVAEDRWARRIAWARERMNEAQRSGRPDGFREVLRCEERARDECGPESDFVLRAAGHELRGRVGPRFTRFCSRAQVTDACLDSIISFIRRTSCIATLECCGDGAEKIKFAGDDRLLEGLKLVHPYLRLELRGHVQRPLDDAGRERLSAGIDKLTDYVQTHPWDATAIWRLGKALEARGDTEAYYTWTRAAAELKPDNADLLRELTHSCILTGRTSEVVAAARRAAARRPRDPDVAANLAEALCRADSFEEALAVARAALTTIEHDDLARERLLAVERRCAGRLNDP